MIEYEELSAGRKDGFVEFVKEEVGKKERWIMHAGGRGIPQAKSGRDE